MAPPPTAETVEPLEEESEDTRISYEVAAGQSDLEFDVVPVIPSSMQSTPTLALMALKLTSQPWHVVGHGSDPNVAASTDMNINVERVTALFLIRIIALVSHRTHSAAASVSTENNNNNSNNNNIPKFSDTSTTNICKEALQNHKPWPKPFTSGLITQLRSFVRIILKKYNNVHYHNFEHAYHVTLSCNKLVDMMLMETSSPQDVAAANSFLKTTTTTTTESSSRSVSFANRKNNNNSSIKKTHGLKNDPLLTLAMLFSALVHDVEHKGISNRQLVMENDELAILYNDQSVAEQRSLAIAFSELMREEFEELRAVMFENSDEYRRFRKTVINLVLSTDIASPERTQIVKSKWKEAFGDTQESRERKIRKELSRRSAFGKNKNGKPPSADMSQRTSQTTPANFRPSPPTTTRYGNNSTNTMSNNNKLLNMNQQLRRGSPGGFSIQNNDISTTSLMSDLTMEAWGRNGGLKNTNNNHNTSTGAYEGMAEIESEEDSTTATPESQDGLEHVENGNTDVVGHGNMTTTGLDYDAEYDESNTAAKTQFSRSKTMDVSQLESQSHANARHESMLTQTAASRRFSLSDATGSSGNSSGRYSIRLGIRRSMDLAGEQIENYSVSSKSPVHTNNNNQGMMSGNNSNFHHVHNSSSMPNIMNQTIMGSSQQEIEYDPDEPDELKAAVVMEQCMRAADIGPNLQGWEQMSKWSGRLFFELKSVHDVGRGEDPQQAWFDNQISFLESYVLPLARRLDDTGVFGNNVGPMFAAICQQNRDRWITDGLSETAQIVQEWNMKRESDKLKMNGCK